MYNQIQVLLEPNAIRACLVMLRLDLFTAVTVRSSHTSLDTWNELNTEMLGRQTLEHEAGESRHPH